MFAAILWGSTNSRAIVSNKEMKQFISILILILLWTQVYSQQRLDRIQTLKINDLDLDCTINDFIHNFGEPDVIKNEYSELDGIMQVKLNYGNSHFTFVENILFYFEIKNSNFELSPYGFCVNETNIDTAKKFFPNSFKAKEEYDNGCLIRFVLIDYYTVTLDFRNNVLSEIYCADY